MALSNRVIFYTPDNDTKIAGLYDLQHTIGRGHYAVVKLARHVFTGEKVAVKVIDKTKLDDIAQDHLFQEVVCMKLVQHPNVVRLYEVIDTPTKLYLILELGDGGDLYDYITKQGCGLHEEVAKRYFRQIVTAIAYCHKLHVVHRDLKPENVVFFEKLGVVKLTDFGFSNRFTPGMHLDTACGSLAYSAPEILLGDPYDAPKVDIWSLGVILYMLVCGRLPFQEGTDSETVTKIMDCEYTIPEYLSSECKTLISRLLVRDPEQRARLDDVLSADWLKPSNSDELPIELFSVPLVSRECLSFEDHMEILSKMSEGKLATVEEIQSTLDRNEYNHIAATYYLLAERKMKRNYVEQYNVLMKQAQMNAKLQQQQLQNSTAADAAWAGQYNETSGKPVCNIPAAIGVNRSIVSTQPASQIPPSAEERIRRFSMILEDEEEEEDEDERKSPMVSSFRQYLAEEYERAGLVKPSPMDSKAFATRLSETLMEEEEEEELATVANLAHVRSDLLTEQTTNAVTRISSLLAEHLPNAGGLTRPGSRASGSVMEVSDGGESDASVSNWSTGGGSALGSAAARSLPTSELRRKSHYRRSAMHHRPLVSVKSSPQLLKHIAEEDWKANIGLPDKNNAFLSNKLNKEYQPSDLSRSSKQKFTDYATGTRSLRSSFHTRRVSLDDHAVGMRSRFSWTGHGTSSTTHSPTRTRRFFTSNAPTSRPTSWNAAFNMSILNEFRRRSVCSSPLEVPLLSSGLTIRRRLPNMQQNFQSICGDSGQIKDRRCSGPPGLMLAVSNFYQLNTLAPAPSLSGSELSFPVHSDHQLHRLTETAETGDSQYQAESLGSSRGSPLTSESTTRGYKTNHGDSVDLKRIPRSEHHSPTHSLSNSHQHALTRSPNRGFSPTHMINGWCNSAPMLFDADTSHDRWYPVSNLLPTALTCVNGPTVSATGAPTLRELCTPIREEEDEAGRSVETGHATNLTATELNSSRRRRSESSDVRAVSSGLSRTVDSESLYVLNQRVLQPTDRHAPLSQLTTSNFSLSSLATSLRDSRYMLDVIRGTFELQTHYGRRTAGSVTGGSSGGLPSERASASASIRSLTAISESLPINTGLTSDLPVNVSRKFNQIRPLTAHEFSLSKTGSVGRRTVPSRRSAALINNSSGHHSLRRNADLSDRFSMLSEIAQSSDMEHHEHSKTTNDASRSLEQSSATGSKLINPVYSLSSQRPRPANADSSTPESTVHGGTLPDFSYHSMSLSPVRRVEDEPRTFSTTFSASLVGFDRDGDLNFIRPHTNHQPPDSTEHDKGSGTTKNNHHKNSSNNNNSFNTSGDLNAADSNHIASPTDPCRRTRSRHLMQALIQKHDHKVACCTIS